MIGAVRDRANQIGTDLGLPQVTGGLVIGIDYAPAAKVTLLLFGPEGVPLLVAKLARRKEAERALVAEHDMLAGLWSSRGRLITADVPRPLALEHVAGRMMLLSTAMPGTPLKIRYYTPGHVRRPDLVAQDFALAGEWLARFQQETRSGTVTLGPDAFDEWIHPTLRRYQAEVGWSGWESGLAGHLAELCARLAGTRVPVVGVHGDYAPGNILLDRDRVSGVVDWELGRRAGLPFSDLLKFAASYGSYLDRAAPPSRGAVAGHPGWSQARQRWGGTPEWTNRTGILYAFFGSGWFPALVRRHLTGHLRRLEVPPAAARLFLLVFLAEQVLALDDPGYRNGYRALLRMLCEQSTSGALSPLEAAG